MTIRKVPFFNYPAIYAEAEEGYNTVIRDVVRRGAFILQTDVAAFEKNLAEYLGVQFAIGVANCTDGLIIALKAAGIGAGDEVIFPSHTFVATAAAIHTVGATPVPADCGADHLIDPDSIAQAVTKRTKAIMPVQLNGRTCQMEAIQHIADRHQLLIVEDAAQSLGSSYKGKKAGTFGVAAAYSFYPAKILGCFGDGGAIVTNDPAIAEQAFLLRDHGRDRHGQIVRWGMNSRLDNLQAAILNYRFQRYDDIIIRRRALAALYHAQLHDLPQLQLPPPPAAQGDHFDVFQNYEIETEQRDAVKQHLAELGVGTLIQWGGTPVHKFPALGFTQVLPATERLFQRCLMLPLYPTMSDDDVQYVCQAIRGFWSSQV